MRKDNPGLYVRPGKEFENVVRESLIKLLKMEVPLSPVQDDFVSKEATLFAKDVPYFWKKANRVLKTMFTKHSVFFEKKYPVFSGIPSPTQSNPLKRPHKDKSRSQQWRDKAKISQDIDKSAIIGSAAYCFQKDGHTDAAYVVKRLHREPEVAKELRKTLDDLDSTNPERFRYLNLIAS